MDSKEEPSNPYSEHNETSPEIGLPSRRWAVVGTATVLASFGGLYVLAFVAWVFMMALAPETFPVIRTLVSLIPGVILMVLMFALIRPVLKGKCLLGVFVLMMIMSVGLVPACILTIGRIPLPATVALVVLMGLASAGAFFAFNALRDAKGGKNICES